MPKKTIEEYKNDLRDKINSLITKRDKLVLDLDKAQKELEILLEQMYALDDTKTRILCLGCRGQGYVQKDDKKVECPYCVGKCYIWADVYSDKESTDASST